MTSATPGLSPGDHAEITDLYARYNLASDAGDAEAYAACFTPDGLLLVRGLSLTATGAMQRGGELRIQGREALAAFKRRDVGGRAGRYRRHWNGSLALARLDGERVRGRCYLQAHDGEPGALPTLAQTGVYDDVLVREGGAWRFASRTLVID
jgi:3-phenylpropionate/cinnamic acid dioxygenase small subunit